MKYSNIFKAVTILTLLLLLIGCGKNHTESYPFSKCDYIEVMSYESRMNWDTINGMSKDYYEYSILEKGRMEVFRKNTIEKIRLSKEQNEKLFDILYKTNCFISEAAACYEPRHSFVFYNTEKKPFASIEVCLDCYGSRETKGVKGIEFCDEKVEKLRKFLESIGIKYFKEK
jgi:hypothetical protein